MRVVSLHPDVLVATSAIWQTNCVIVRSGGPLRPAGEEAGGEAREAPQETFAIDSPVLPEELEALPALLAQAGWGEPNGLLATHGDWDHLLGRLAFPEAALGCAQSTVDRLDAAPGQAQRELRDFDRQFYIPRTKPLMLGQLQALPVPGRCSIGAQELELHPAEGHTPDGMAIWIPWAAVLVVGDYLSTVEGPEVEDVGAYIETLERLRPLAESANHVVPGHGPVIASERALAVLEDHLTALQAGA